MLKSAVLFLTWNCNMNCPYCWERQAQKNGKFTPEPFIDTDKWIESINKLDIQTLDISGGEPFSQPRFYDLIKGINVPRVAITTNISYDLTSFVRDVSPDRIISMTVSYHPTQKMSFESFLGKCLFLRENGFNITINYVTYPEQMYLIPTLKAQLLGMGFKFHVDPYVPTEFFPYTFSQEELDFLAPYVAGDRVKPTGDPSKPKMCSGGRDHLNIHPTGDAFRCIHDKVLGLDKVGNIFDKDFKLNKRNTQCDDWANCSGCDRDKVTMNG